MIDHLIKENRCFAFYRLPLENHIHFLLQNNHSADTLQRVEELNEQNAFVIAPFHTSPKHPIVLIRPEKEEILSIPQASTGQEYNSLDASLPTDDYRLRFSTFVNTVKENQFQKLVLSRKKEILRESFFSPEQAFYLACNKYIYSYVYICHTPQTGTWIGCTPEILLANNSKYWQTVALAGTQTLPQENETPVWDEKNKLEQCIVADYIRKQLALYNIEPIEKGPYTVRAGKLVHLKSDFYFSLPDNHRLGSLLNDLHPTPAICGLPKTEAKQFILENEGYNRSYYSGFIGRLQPAKNTNLYVNLRCMQIESQKLTLYAGGGILPSSVLNDEWIETENKLQTMLVLSKANVYG